LSWSVDWRWWSWSTVLFAIFGRLDRTGLRVWGGLFQVSYYGFIKELALAVQLFDS